MEQLLTVFGKATEDHTLASFLLITFLLIITIFTIILKRIDEFKYKDLHIKFHKEEIKRQTEEHLQTKVTRPARSRPITSPKTRVLRPRGKGLGKAR